MSAWLDFAARNGAPSEDEARAVAAAFGPEIEDYCELVRGLETPVAGLMTRGAGESFTARAQAVLEAWDMPAGGVSWFQALADRFEHVNAFLKLEWAPQGRLAAFYFRRRPDVEEVLGLHAARGVSDEVLGRALGVARMLEKDSVHFVAAALRPGSEVHHKLYFSQLVTPERRLAVLRRILSLAEALELDTTAAERLAELHGRLLPRSRECTAFVSVSFTASRFVPELKIDYPQVEPTACLELIGPLRRDAAARDIDALCATAGVDALSYVGVRCRRSGPLGVKLYADVSG